MRSAPLVVSLALTALAGLAGVLQAQSSDAFLYDAAIQVDATDARCGPSDSPLFYPTNHLKLGDRVRVVKEVDGGWLAIQPPNGSFSWINKRLLTINTQGNPPIYAVDAPEAPVRIGSNVTTVPPTVVGVTKKRGLQVTLIANSPENTDQEGTWIAIEPPPGEVRYIRAETIKKATPAGATGVVVAAPPAANAPPVQDAEALSKRALEAEKWNVQEAINLWNEAANVETNPQHRIEYLNRAHYLAENLRNPAPTLIPAPPPGGVAAVGTANESKVYPLNPAPEPGPTVRLAPPQGSGVSPVNPTPGTTNTWSAAPSPTWDATNGAAPRAPASPVAPTTGVKVYSTGPGLLRASGHPPIEGRKAYLMFDERGVPFYYVTDWTGGELDKYVNHRVELFGEAITSGDLRKNYMRASRVELREGQ